MQQTQAKKARTPEWHHPRTTNDPDKVVKLGFPVRHSERIAVQKMAAAHGLSVKDLLLEGADLLHAKLEQESGRGSAGS